MTTLTDFLLARTAEDESAILNRWDSDGKARVATMWTGGEPGYATVASDHGDDVWIAAGREVKDARHVRVLFDPARVLAECEAKRRIVEIHTPSPRTVLGTTWDECSVCFDPDTAAGDYDFEGWPCPTLCALALPYADHPDYREEWKP